MSNRHSSSGSSSDPRSLASRGERWSWMNWATISLICLVLQNLSLIHFLKESRVEGHKPYSVAEAVVVCEIIKLLACTAVLVWKYPARQALRAVINLKELMYLSVPAALYTVQNILIYYSFTALDAVTFQILYQSKILTLAFFLRICMRRTLRPLQIASLLLLMAGIILTQTASATVPSAPLASEEEGHPRKIIAAVCVLLAAVSSGFAGVYTEMILKGKMGPAEPSPVFARIGRQSTARCETPHPPPSCLFVKNAQMSVLGVLFGTVAWFQADGARSVLRPGHLLAGWTGAVWMAVLTGAVGGLVISAVMKYADNMLKTFATSISIVVSMCASIAAGDTPPHPQMIAGIAMVVLASVIYAWKSSAPASYVPLQLYEEKMSGSYQTLDTPVNRLVVRSYNASPRSQHGFQV